MAANKGKLPETPWPIACEEHVQSIVYKHKKKKIMHAEAH